MSTEAHTKKGTKHKKYTTEKNQCLRCKGYGHWKKDCEVNISKGNKSNDKSKKHRDAIYVEANLVNSGMDL